LSPDISVPKSQAAIETVSIHPKKGSTFQFGEQPLKEQFLAGLVPLKLF
jgi:hypothetical protein